MLFLVKGIGNRGKPCWGRISLDSLFFLCIKSRLEKIIAIFCLQESESLLYFSTSMNWLWGESALKAVFLTYGCLIFLD